MTRILIVDDDQGQLRLLARVVSMRRRDFTVLTACHGLEAVEVLSAGPIDLVLTDLQMPEMNGFELMAWVLSHQPHVPVYSMTAYPTEADRLSELGSIACFTKPLDIPVLLERVSQVLAEGVRGHVRNIGLPSFLQLLEMEQKSCTLTVEAAASVGYLYLERGQLVDARAGELGGVTAALEILGWREPAITILEGCAARTRTIEVPTRFLVMDALRREDERGRDDEEPPSWPDFEPKPVSSRAPSAVTSSLSRFPVYLPADARAIALIARNGRVRTAAGELDGLDSHAGLVAKLYQAEESVVQALGLEDEVHEMVVTSQRHWTLVRPIGVDPGSLVMLVFDPARANVVMERRELIGFVDELEQWCRDQLP